MSALRQWLDSRSTAARLTRALLEIVTMAGGLCAFIYGVAIVVVLSGAGR